MNDKHTILIVDDEPKGRKTLQVLLMTHDYTLAFAADGQEALVKAAELTPDVILLDVMMPGMDGFAVCRQLRAIPNLAEIPVIMVTALDDQDSRLQGIEAGADDFVSKPFDRAELRARIQTTTRLNRYRRLLAERTKFEWVVEQADDGYLLINSYSDILYANPQARLYLGLPADNSEPVLDTFLFLARRQYNLKSSEVWEKWFEQPVTDTPLYLVQPASHASEAFWLQVDLIATNPQNEGEYLIRLRNITREVLKQRLTWSFHSQVSHKLRTPLALVNGLLELIEEDEENDFSSEQKVAMLSKINAGTLQLREKISEIFKYLDTADMIKAGQSECDAAEISQLVDQIESDLGLQSVTKNFDESFTSLEQAQLPISRQSLTQILQELLENAQKFHPQQSPSIEVEVFTNENRLHIQVIDDGLTLSPEQLAKIWNPYYQAERYFTGQISGMGLGLSVIASIVWSAGGTCRAYNRDDTPGLKIELTIPLLNNNSIATKKYINRDALFELVV